MDRNGSRHPRPPNGYLFVPADADGPMAPTDVGTFIRSPQRGPPWIVVDHALSSTLMTRWPGRLWRVEITDPAPEADQTIGPYTRALGIRTVQELPAWILFGPHGAAVAAVLDRAQVLTEAEARALADTRHPDAGRAYGAAWRAWLMSKGMPAPDDPEMLDGTLLADSDRSPIGSGLALLSTELWRRAHRLVGAAADLGGEEPALAEPWNTAAAALRDAALALGAPALVGAAGAAVLTHAWDAITAP